MTKQKRKDHNRRHTSRASSNIINLNLYFKMIRCQDRRGLVEQEKMTMVKNIEIDNIQEISKYQRRIT